METNWTDVLQAIAAIIGIPGTIVALIVLIKRDKNRESEILSLSEIAQQLMTMQKQGEKRYRTGKRPHISITSHHKNNKQIDVFFTNSNYNSTLIDYKVKINGCQDCELKRVAVNQLGREQNFNIQIHYKNNPPELFALNIDYITEEGFEFIQDVLVIFTNPEYRISSMALIDKLNAA